MKKIIITVLVALMLTTTAFASNEVTSFSDVPSTHWAYSNIMTMTEQGLFSGTTDPVDGVGTFAPSATMTRAEFITVVMRALYRDELTTSDPWWKAAYDLAVTKGILLSTELDSGNMTAPMSRQEMALVLVRAANETPAQFVATSKIADYSTINDYYKDYVVKAYSMGMLAGTDAKGTYAPNATMDRAQGATVLNRLTNKAARVAVDFSIPSPVTDTKSVDAANPTEVATCEESREWNVCVKARYYALDVSGYDYIRVTAQSAMDTGVATAHADMKNAVAGNGLLGYESFNTGTEVVLDVADYSAIVLSVSEALPYGSSAFTPLTLSLIHI